MADTRNCPKCDTLMDYRLGEYECPSCGHTEGSAQSVGGVQSGRGLSGPGFQQPPPPPPGGNVPGMPGSRMGYQGSPLEPGYGGGGAGAGFDSLESEKNLYIYIRVGLWALLLIAMIVISATGAGMMAGTGVGGMMWAAVLVILLYALVDIGLLFFILKSDQTWAKYCCMGCMGLRLIGIIFSAVGLRRLRRLGPRPAEEPGLPSALGEPQDAFWLTIPLAF